MLCHGKVPSDGLIGITGSYRLRPDVKTGQRLSGTVTINPVKGCPSGVTHRLLVDGEPQQSTTIDTTQWADGTHVLSFQAMAIGATSVANGSDVVVFNNSGKPFISLEDQAIVADYWGSNGTPNSLAWGRVNVLGSSAYPLDPQLDKHPNAATDSDRHRLATQKVWWVEGLTHQPTCLWKDMPIAMKNKDGDLFIKHWNPQGGGAGVTPVNAKPYVEQAPAYDGPRGIGFLNPYASLNPYYERPLASGNYGWVAVEKSGRVVTVDITGEIRTILGPRSVSGVPGTDCDEMTVPLAARLANGEKEYVGNMNGQMLSLPHDIWPCSSFPFEGIIADTGNNQVTEIHFEQQRLMRRWPLAGVTSVCDSVECQQDPAINIIWFAVNPEGLWCQRHIVAAPGTREGMPGGRDGSFTGHVPTLEKLADIPDAFWVRCLGTRVFVFTKDLGIYEYDAITGTLTERLVRRKYKETYVFASIDYNGSIGPVGRIYWGSASQKNGGYGSSKTSIFWLDSHTWEQGSISKSLLANKVTYGSWTAGIDPMGHYMWGIAIHPTMPKILTCGIASSSWFLWTGCLGEPLEIDPAIPSEGTLQYRNGVLDKYLGLAPIFGYSGHGQLGYSCDMWRNYKTYSEAREAMREFLNPLFAADVSEADRENIAKKLFMQRTRKHYQDGISIPDPDSNPDPDPPPEPLKLNSVSISGGVPPYAVTIVDSKGTIITKTVS